MLSISSIQQKHGAPMALIILCCRHFFKTATTETLNEFLQTNEIDWTTVKNICANHRIRPLVFRVLLQAGIPAEIGKQLTNELKYFSAKSIENAVETERILEIFKNNGIAALPYKGTAFSKQFFGSIDMRESSDIDLVIQPADLPRIISILVNDAYGDYSKDHYAALGHSAYIEKCKDYSFDKFADWGRLHHVEVHYNIIAKYFYLPAAMNVFDTDNFELNKLVRQAQHFLTPQEHFRAVCLHHILQDGLFYLKTLVDIGKGAVVLQQMQTSNHGKTALQEVIEQLNACLDLSLLEDALNKLLGIALQPQKTKLLLLSKNVVVENNLQHTVETTNNKILPLGKALVAHYETIKRNSPFYVKKKDKLRQAYRYLIHIISPQLSDYSDMKIHKSLFIFYFLARPFRLLFKHKKPT